MDSEQELLRLASAGSENAFAGLFQQYKHKLYSFTLRLTDNPDMAEDVVQDVFLKLWKNRSELAVIENLGGYIFKIAHNQVVNAVKRSANEQLILEELYRQQPVDDQSTEHILYFRETQNIVSLIVEKLPPQQKLIYKLSREDGLKHDEIAHKLELAPSTVKNHIVQALTTIREQLRLHSITISMIAFIFTLKK